MGALNVVCLISGGKDSLFSILHCLENGHHVVAIANLHPPADSPLEDMDSYMYQTVGHTIIPMYEQALGLPLYRHEITGMAADQNKCYRHTIDEDETEALVPLLRMVKSRHPQVNAVSTGAILSDYQRTRVESVAIRLGLVPLSYLWQWPNLRPHTPDSLLRDMGDMGQDSRIIKVASGGLDDSMLWRDVSDPNTISRLNKAAERFGNADDGAVLGEGGEYETLAIAGPPPLWKGRIVIDNGARENLAGEAGSASVRVLHAQVENLPIDINTVKKLSVPASLEPGFQAVFDEIRLEEIEATFTETNGAGNGTDCTTRPDGVEAETTASNLDRLFLYNLFGKGDCAADQMKSIMESAADALQASGHDFQDVAYASIILRDMADFPHINTVYGSYFALPNPPARATLACGSVLPDGRHVMVAFTSTKTNDTSLRKGLHVQSRSYWAPANIGPYSQAIQIPEEDNIGLIYVAGQIPLLPASMQLPSVSSNENDDFTLQTVLALQHLDRIGRVMHVRHWAFAIAFVNATSQEIAKQRSTSARKAWEAYHRKDDTSSSSLADSDSEQEGFDVWQTNFGSAKSWARQANDSYSTTSDVIARPPPLYVIHVDALPRGSQIEWVSFGRTGGAGASITIPHLQHLLRIFSHQVVR